MDNSWLTDSSEIILFILQIFRISDTLWNMYRDEYSRFCTVFSFFTSWCSLKWFCYSYTQYFALWICFETADKIILVNHVVLVAFLSLCGEIFSQQNPTIIQWIWFWYDVVCTKIYMSYMFNYLEKGNFFGVLLTSTPQKGTRWCVMVLILWECSCVSRCLKHANLIAEGMDVVT